MFGYGEIQLLIITGLLVLLIYVIDAYANRIVNDISIIKDIALCKRNDNLRKKTSSSDGNNSSSDVSYDISDSSLESSSNEKTTPTKKKKKQRASEKTKKEKMEKNKIE